MNIKNSLMSLILVLSQIVWAQNPPTPADETESLEATSSAIDLKSQNIQIDENDLPEESVTPKTDLPVAVINKKLKLSRRVGFDLATGNILDEPLANANYFQLRASYYVDEEMSFGLGYRSRFGGKTSYSQQLFDGTAQLEFERAPEVTTAIFANMGYVLFYGKLSLAKKAVITSTTKIDSDLGMQKTGSLQRPFAQASVTQTFFMNQHFGFGLSYGLSLAQTYDPTSVNIRSTEPRPSESDFALKMRINQSISLNLTTLL